VTRNPEAPCHTQRKNAQVRNRGSCRCSFCSSATTLSLNLHGNELLKKCEIFCWRAKEKKKKKGLGGLGKNAKYVANFFMMPRSLDSPARQ
jgi:hypothetical protein